MVKDQVEPKKIFYVDKGDFLRSMLEFALKAKGAQIYTIDTLENNIYLLDDLLPDLIIFDVETCRDYLAILEQYRDKTILVATGEEEKDRPLVNHMIKDFLPKPLVARGIAARILALVE